MLSAGAAPVLARLLHWWSFSLAELHGAIRELTADLNNRPMRHLGVTAQGSANVAVNGGEDWFSRTLRAVVAVSWGVQDAGPQELEAGSAIHRPLDHLDAVDLAFGGARGPGQVESRLHRRQVTPQTGPPANMVLVEGLFGIEHTGAEERKARSSIHGALDHLEAADLALHGACGPGQLQGGLDRSDVPAQRRHERPQQRATCRLHHRGERLLALVTQQEREPPGCGNGVGQARCLAQQPGDETGVVGVRTTGIGHHQAGDAAGGWQAQDRAVLPPQASPYLGRTLLADPRLDCRVSPPKAQHLQLAPQQGRVAASFD